MPDKVTPAARRPRSNNGRYLLFWLLIGGLAVIAFLPMYRTPNYVKALYNEQFSLLWPPKTEEPATVKVGELKLRVIASLPGSLEAVTQLPTASVATSASSDEAVNKAEAEALSEAKAKNLGALTNLYLLAVAFVLAAVTSIWFSLSSAEGINKFKKNSWQRFWTWSAGFAVVGSLTGAVLVLRDPLGPIVTYDVTFSGGQGMFSSLESMFSAPIGAPATNPIAAAQNKMVVQDSTALSVAGLVLACGGLGGSAAFCFLLYVYAVLSHHSVPGLVRPKVREIKPPDDELKAEEREWRKYGNKLAAPLKKRRENLPLCVTFASIALSLGVAIINAFLGWGLGFLDEESREIATTIADAGTAYYGGIVAIIAIAGSALAFISLRSDIEAAARDVYKREPSGVLVQDLDWKKNNDLEFEPVKAISTFVVALGPVLTTGLLKVLSTSVV